MWNGRNISSTFLAGTAGLLGILIGLSFTGPIEHLLLQASSAPPTSKLEPVKVAAEPVELNEYGVPLGPTVPQPGFLKGVLPSKVRSLAIQNINENGLKLIAWAEHFNDSYVALVDAKLGQKTKLLWKSDEIDVYCPHIMPLADNFSDGHPVVIVFGARGAAYEVAMPVHIHNGKVDMLTFLEATRFEILKIDGKEHLVGTERTDAYLPSEQGKKVYFADMSKPEIYDLKNDEFEESNSSHSKYLLSVNKYNEADWCSLYEKAEFLQAVDCADESIAVLNKIRSKVLASKVPELEMHYAQMMHDMDNEKEAKYFALEACKEIANRKLVEHYSNEQAENRFDGTVSSDTVNECTQLLSDLGRKKEAAELSKRVKQFSNG